MIHQIVWLVLKEVCCYFLSVQFSLNVAFVISNGQRQIKCDQHLRLTDTKLHKPCISCVFVGVVVGGSLYHSCFMYSRLISLSSAKPKI